MKNSEVADCWKNGKSAKVASMRTDGTCLFSYNLKIGFTDDKGRKVALDYSAPNNFISNSTSKHVGYAKGSADITINP